ncbi:T9SS type A sorting domain-containing protein [Salibacter sp.]|uniref:T9SS type A sorting domain-containing protein n=1 Tax=Salibacter sp. TaxID=2010995 RepID=UPI0028705B17|nr:T9SS type A sorting domain-containing protein [Salibacter sp.]MDR9487954.1 T9SS type A sorting domain-containing protein [Salibacter sp.]
MRHKILFSVFTLLTAFAAKAQITIDSSDIGNVGDKIYMLNDTAVTGLTVGAGSSSAQSWDFTALSYDLVDSVEFESKSNYPEGSQFPNSSFAISLENGIIGFASKTDQEFVIDGLSGDITGQGVPVVVKPDGGLKQIEFPSTLNDSFLDTTVIDSTLEVNQQGVDSARLKRTYHIESLIDAHGSLEVPGEVHNDVIRQYYMEAITDSVWAYNSFLGWQFIQDSVQVTHTYNYYAKGRDFPVLTVDATGGTGTIISAMYQAGDAPTPVYTVNNLTCYDDSTGSVTVDNVIGGAGPYTYNWSNGATGSSATNLSAGNYTVTVYGATDSAVTSVTVNQPDSIQISETVTQQTNGGDGGVNISVSGGTAPYSFMWSTGASTQNLQNLSAGTYTVTVNDDKFCSKSKSFTIDPLTSVGEKADREELRLYPNPVGQNLRIDAENEVNLVEVMDITGKLVLTVRPDSKFVTIETADWNNGLYLVKVSLDDHEVIRKVVK